MELVAAVLLTSLLALSAWLWRLERDKARRVPHARDQALLEAQSQRDAEFSAKRLKEFNKEQRKLNSGKMAHKPRDGFVWNPLRNYPRNAPCFCGAAKKAKACCLPNLPPAIDASREKAAQRLVRMAARGDNLPALMVRLERQTAKSLDPRA